MSKNVKKRRPSKFKKFVLSPDFEIRTGINIGIERKNLIIFDENDKSKCYIYGFHNFQNLYRCKNCWKQRIRVTAKLHQNSEGEDYIIQSNVQHICESVEYIPQKEDIILRPPDFQFIERTCSPRLFIFDSKDKNLCYVFSRHYTAQGHIRFRCCGCKYIVRKKKLSDNLNGIVYVSLYKDEKGEYYVQMKNQKHLCQPTKYEPEKFEFEMIEKKETKIAYEYFYYHNEKYPKSVYVAIIHPTDSTLCYTFSYKKNFNIFQCLKCKNLKKYYRISPPKMDENGKEYFINNQEKHICKPIKISSIQTSEFHGLQRNEIVFEEKPKKKEVKIDESVRK